MSSERLGTVVGEQKIDPTLYNVTEGWMSQTFTEDWMSQTFTEDRVSQTFTEDWVSQTFTEDLTSQTFTAGYVNDLTPGIHRACNLESVRSSVLRPFVVLLSLSAVLLSTVPLYSSSVFPAAS